MGHDPGPLDRGRLPSGDNEFEITAQVQFGGTTPNMGGRGIIDQALPFKCLETDAAPPIKVVMTNSTED